jgi:catechol 2,3-dioxygenase-like lactoylglutathione lyase family enzyme
MTGEPRQTVARPVLNSIAPQLFVSDIKRSCEFFTAKLGFVVDFLYGEPPFYGQVSRDNARFVLRVIDEPVFTEAREREHLLSAAITVATLGEIKQLYRDYDAAGVVFRQTLRTEPWGATTFVAADPDGNLSLPVPRIRAGGPRWAYRRT